MQDESSASNMVLRELNHNSQEVTHDLQRPTHVSSPKKVVVRARKSRQGLQNDIQHKEEKQSQSAIEIFLEQKKQSISYFATEPKVVSHQHLNGLSQEKTTQVKIENFTSVQRSQKSQKTKKRSVILLQNILSTESYVKRLMTYLPSGSFCLANIIRQKSMFSTNVTMTINGEEMIKAKKMKGLFSSGYQIVSENQRQNTLGYVKSNFSGSTFNVWQENELNEHRLVSTIWYEDSFSFRSGPRLVEMYVLHPQETVDDLIDSGQVQNLKELYERGSQRKITKLTSRQPQIGHNNEYCMDFGVDHVLPSVKNVVLENETGDAILILCKTNQDLFELKIRQNISAFIGYCFALSSLTFKLACQ